MPETANGTDLLELARKAIDETWNPDWGFMHWCEEELGENYDQFWCGVYSRNRDSDIHNNSNFDAWVGILNDEKFEEGKDFCVQNFSCDLVGWREMLLVKALNKTRTEITPIFKRCIEIRDSVNEYPLDEEDIWRRETEATLENIKENRPINGDVEWNDDLPEDWATQVYGWLSHNDDMQLEDVDGRGGYPSEESIAAAGLALGLCTNDGEDLSEEQPYHCENTLEINFEEEDA